jgi:hypothetical protein
MATVATPRRLRALFGLCDCIGCRLGFLPAGVVFDLAFAAIDVPQLMFLLDPDR